MASNPYYEDTFSGQPGQTARAEAVTQQLDAIQSGFDGVLADVNRTLKGQPGETLNPLVAAANRANQWLRFDASGQPIVVNAPFNWTGYWQPNTLYHVGDVMQPAAHQSLMYCTVQHTSGSVYSATDWSVFIDLTGVPFNNYGLINAAGTTQLNKGDSWFVDCSAGAITLNMPANPVLGDNPVNITHVGGSLSGSQTLTLYAPGGFQGNTNTTITVDVQNASMTIAYAGVNYGWRLRTMG